MKNLDKKTIIISLCTLLVGVLAGWLIFGNQPQEAGVEHNHNTVTDTETVWTCSMHPQIRNNEPGDCPICGMDLIPLENGDSELDANAISMSSTAMALANVQTLIIQNKSAQKTIRLNGKVQADERLLVTQSSHIPGRVEKLTVNFTGDYISKGQVIAYVYSPDLVTAQEELFEAQKIKDKQPALFSAAQEKLRNWKLTDAQINKILSSNKAIEEFPILANVSGYVTKKSVNLGDYLKVGAPIYEVADLSRVWVLFDIYETDLMWVKKGDEINYTIQSQPGTSFKGKVSYIDPTIDAKTRVARARVEVSNKNMLLKPEMFASGEIITAIEKDETITIPKSSVMWTGKRSIVYVINKTSQGVSFIMREVTLGPELGESYIIQEGLKSGDEIAINGTFSIDAAAQLAGKPSMMNPTGGAFTSGHHHEGVSNEMTSQDKEIKKLTISNEAKTSLKPLYTDYFKLKDALVESQFEEARNEAKKFKESVNGVKMPLFKEGAHNELMKLFAEFKLSLEHADHWSEIEEVRRAFIPLSKSMIRLTKTFNPYDEKLYVQYCPMAANNTGANWISVQEEILNPYFGEAMLTCGNVEEELNITTVVSEPKDVKPKSKSPKTSAMGNIGETHVHIDYSSPSVRGRTIWGGLVGYDKVWASGAHKATAIDFSKDVVINNVKVPAGKYGFFTIPGKEEWTVILSKDWDMHLADDYNQANDLLRLIVKPTKLSETVESLRYEVIPVNEESGQIKLLWSDLSIAFNVINN